MKMITKKVFLVALTAGLILASCSNEEETPIGAESDLNTVSATASIISPSDFKATVEFPKNLMSNDFDLDLSAVVQPSSCGDTPFNTVIDQSVASNLDALGAEWYGLYAEMNFLYTITDESPQYFGENGEYTNLMKKITRNLKKFWKNQNEIMVRGQHNSTLNDKAKVIEILTFWYGLPEGLASDYADLFVDSINVESTFLIETPLLSFDGFTIDLQGQFDQNDLIVIGDGLVELASEAGVQDKVVWEGIMAHEWGHQLQINNSGVWEYPGVDISDPAEDTRSTELEADFFTGYYLTHKRGGTYNWKRTQDFLELFFNIGDCGFTSPGHHGTPDQRLEAARQGYLMAVGEKKKGKISSADKVHNTFISKLSGIVGGSDFADNGGDLQ